MAKNIVTIEKTGKEEAYEDLLFNVRISKVESTLDRLTETTQWVFI